MICVKRAAPHAYAHIFVSYETQLQFAELHSMPNALCENIAATCPNMRFTVENYLPLATLLSKCECLDPR